MGVTRAPDGQAELGQNLVPFGQLDASQGQGLPGDNLVGALELNEIGGYVYGDQLRTEPTQQETRPGLSTN